MNRTEMLDFHGVSRSVLEQRIVELVAAVDNLEKRSEDLKTRLLGRVEMNSRTAIVHSEPICLGRLDAYRTALADLREILLSST